MNHIPPNTPLNSETQHLFRIEPVPLTEKNQHLFQSRLNPAQKDQLRQLLEQTTSTLGADYLLAYGTLLGALLYEGMIPWDDDLDLHCKFEDYAAIKRNILAHPHLAWHDDPHPDGTLRCSKVFLKNAATQPPNTWHHPWTWPFVDILWLQECSDTHVMNLYSKLKYLKSDLFPATFKTFEGKTYPCPNNSVKVILHRHPYALQWAIPSDWDHVRETPMDLSQLCCIPLEALQTMYPILHQTLGPLRQAHATPAVP